MLLPSALALVWAVLSAASELEPAAEFAQDSLFGRVWKPRVGQPFQIVLSATIDAGGFFSGRVEPSPVQIFDLDLFDNTAATIRKLHSEGKKVICYFSAGTSETWRPDFREFKPKDQAAPLPMWPGERWLNVNSTDVLKIMRSRIRLASRKGCDAVDPDNMDGYSNPELLGRMSTVIKVLSLDGWVMYCNGLTWETKGHAIAINPINQGKGKGKEGGVARAFQRIESELPVDGEYEYHLQNDFDDYTDEMDAKINAELDKQLEGITFNTKRRGSAKERRPSLGYQSAPKR